MSNSILDQTQSKTALPKTNPKSNPHHFSCLRLRKTSPTSQQRTLETVEIFQRSLRTGAHGHGNTILVSTWHVQGLGHQWLRSRADASHPLRPQHWSLLWRDASRYVKGGTDDDLGTWRTIDGQRTSWQERSTSDCSAACVCGGWRNYILLVSVSFHATSNSDKQCGMARASFAHFLRFSCQGFSNSIGFLIASTFPAKKSSEGTLYRYTSLPGILRIVDALLVDEGRPKFSSRWDNCGGGIQDFDQGSSLAK